MHHGYHTTSNFGGSMYHCEVLCCCSASQLPSQTWQTRYDRKLVSLSGRTMLRFSSQMFCYLHRKRIRNEFPKSRFYVDDDCAIDTWSVMDLQLRESVFEWMMLSVVGTLDSERYGPSACFCFLGVILAIACLTIALGEQKLECRKREAC
jgi:hypothetical protein